MSHRYTHRLFIGLLALLPCLSSAALIVDRAIVEFEPGQSMRQDVTITNSDPVENLYVKVELLEVINPGTEQEERKPVTNPDEVTFLVTPNKLIVPPNGAKRIRLVNLQPNGDTERVYRINVHPVLPPAEVEQTTVRVIVGYQLLVLVQPAKPFADLKVERDGNKIRFANLGNTNVLLRNGRQCPSADALPVDCVELPTRRLYAGNTYEIEVNWKDQPVEYFTTIGQQHKKLVIEPQTLTETSPAAQAETPASPVNQATTTENDET